MSSFTQKQISGIQREASFYAAVAVLSLFAAISTGCGKQAFVVQRQVARIAGAGTFDIAPKVDLVMAMDDTGAMSEAFSTVSSQVPGFLTKLEGRGWDYHFSTIRLTTPRDMNQVIGSRHDIGWGSMWVPPYPGAPYTTVGMINPLVFRTPQNYTAFLTTGDVDTTLGSKEPAFETLVDALGNKAPGTGMLRSDALTVVLFVSLGEETSRVNYCQGPAGLTFNPATGPYVPCDGQGHANPQLLGLTSAQLPACTTLPPVNGNRFVRDSNGNFPPQACASRALSLAHYEGAIRAFKGGNLAQTKVYSAVSPVKGPCSIGGGAFAGTRYVSMANNSGGQAYNVCTTPIVSVLDAVSNNLQAQRSAFRTRYVFIEMEPNPDTIEVTITRASGEVEIIPNDAIDGWTYAGEIPASAPVHAIDYPVPLNLQSGFAIELHGAAKLIGDDVADITYKPAGVNDSVSQ